MQIEMIAGWQFGLGIMVSKEGCAIFLPVVMIFISFKHYKRFSFSLEKHF